MNLLTIFILTCIIAVGIVFRNTLQRLAFALLWAYAHEWDKWIKKVEFEHEMMERRTVLSRRE